MKKGEKLRGRVNDSSLCFHEGGDCGGKRTLHPFSLWEERKEKGGKICARGRGGVLSQGGFFFAYFVEGGKEIRRKDKSFLYVRKEEKEEKEGGSIKKKKGRRGNIDIPFQLLLKGRGEKKKDRAFSVFILNWRERREEENTPPWGQKLHRRGEKRKKKEIRDE